VRQDIGSIELPDGRLQMLVCKWCGAIGDAIDGDISEHPTDLALVPGAEGLLRCHCGGHEFYAIQRTIETEETR